MSEFQPVVVKNRHGDEKVAYTKRELVNLKFAGYAAAPDASVPDPADAEPGDTTYLPFDPNAHTAAEVKAKLAELAEAGDDAEYERVWKAEESGQNRSTAFH